MKEPKRLSKGKLFHKQIQSEWKAEAEGDVKTEHCLTKPNGKTGRADILVNPQCKMVAVAEIKASEQFHFI